ncbi:MAG: phospho-N-acetylmuramoyl-pentapeptide-transferase [Candidatus Nanoperiomorbaceae bacterium]
MIAQFQPLNPLSLFGAEPVVNVSTVIHQATLNHLATPLGRTFLIGLLALVVATILTPIYTYFAYKYHFWKREKTVALDGKKLTVMNKLHANKIKRHLPTMAGMIFVITVAGVTLATNLSRGQTWLPLAALLVGGLVGLIDDVINLRGHSAVAGLRAPVKFAMITIAALVLGWFFWARLGWTTLHIPFVGDWNIGIWMILLFALAVVATGNAVNLSDGLDGLAGGLALFAFASFAAIAFLQGQFGVAIFCITVIGALVSYLWFNIFPARFMMGDVGSFALGCALAVVAMMTDSLFLLPIIGAVFVVDTGSAVIQIIYKKITHGKKIWLSTPIHHHFEAIGWPETKVTMRFWLLGAVAGIVGLVLALLGGTIK